MQKVEEESLLQMRRAGGRWAAYENLAMDSASMGHVQYLKFGEGCTFKTAPLMYPADTVHGMGWRYRLIGEVDLDSGEVKPVGQS